MVLCRTLGNVGQNGQYAEWQKQLKNATADVIATQHYDTKPPSGVAHGDDARVGVEALSPR